jgi:NADH:ubiquinone oxidoreductase subunit F (NADH-binding)
MIAHVGLIEPDVESFYALPAANLAGAACSGAACFVARHIRPARWQKAAAQSPRVHCLGKCYAGPAEAAEQATPLVAVRSRRPVVLERIVKGGARTIDSYESQGGLSALRQVLSHEPARTLAEIEKSELRGRGGAGFPTGAKWRVVAAAANSGDKYVVANFDEGDPGAYIDRILVEEDPFSLIEGMVIAAFAVGARHGWIYARGEYPDAIAIVRQAICDARRAGLLGDRILGSNVAFDVDVIVGRGSYVCGEETALLNSIEARRPIARIRPPFVAERGLYGQPTVVNNVETLANIAWIIRHGAESFESLGVPGSRGTKAISLNSLFRNAGLYEVEFGVTLRDIVEVIGGGLTTGALKGVMIGGPLAGVVPPQLLDVRLGFDELRAIGASVGHGGVIAFDEHTSIPELVEHVFSFGAYESCGLCTPCRLGAPTIERIAAGIVRGRPPSSATRAEWNDVVAALKLSSLCGLGSGLAEFAESVEKYYAEELWPCCA